MTQRLEPSSVCTCLDMFLKSGNLVPIARANDKG